MERAPTALPVEREELLPTGLVVSLLIGLGAVALSRPVLAFVACTLALVCAVGLLWLRFGLARVRYGRVLQPTHVFPGEPVTLELVLENAKLLPLPWIEVQDEFPAHLVVEGVQLERTPRFDRRLLRTLFSVGARERVRRRYQVRALRRGLYRFGPATLVTGDPFGLARTRRDWAWPNDLVVYPALRPLASFGLPAEHPLGEATPLRPLLEDPLQVRGVRPYQPGDPPRRIHWRATARTGELQVRVLERRASPTVALFLDVNTFEYFWEGVRPHDLEWAISLCASLADWGLDAGYQVGLWVNAPLVGGERFIRILPSSHPRQLQRILEALALLVPHTGYRIETLLRAELRVLPQGATIVLVTAQMTDPLRRTLLALQRQGYAVALVAVGVPAGLSPRRGLAVYELGVADAPVT